MSNKVFKAGFVSILGRPNVGKSTILNSIIREKVSIVSPKPQTTRNKIFGIYNDDESQIVFIDTPGVHKSQNELDSYMQKSINSAKRDVDVLLVVFDSSKPFTQREIDFLTGLQKDCKNMIVVLNKVDLVNYEKVFPILAKLNELDFIKEVIPVSGAKRKNIDPLITLIKKYLPEGQPFYDRELYTDKSVKFMCAEIIREKALWLLREEIPHGIGVVIDVFDDSSDRVNIDATIVTEKKTHKQIIIGENGEMLKEIGTRARIEIEKMLGKKVFLQLFVKVREDWRDSNYLVSEFGYNIKEI